jgi:dTDP-4-amino-4,6-dideoxygalactose transaminase/uncharacterized protein (DUF2225 family)
VAEKHFFRKVSCPLCKKEFQTPVLKTSAAILEERDSDLCAKYKEDNPTYYAVYVCPSCGYTSLDEDFKELREREKKEIASLLLGDKDLRVMDPNFWEFPRKPETVLKLYKRAIKFYSVRKNKSFQIAKCYHRIACFHRFRNERVQEKEFLKQAVRFYSKAYESEDLSREKLGELGVMYIIGDIHRRLGNYEEATKWFSRVASHPEKEKSPTFVKMARDQWLLTKEEKKRSKDTKYLLQKTIDEFLKTPPDTFSSLPVAENPIPFSKPYIGDEEEKAVLSVLKSGWLTSGKKVKEFEERISSIAGTKYAVATNSCTSALELALDVMGVGPGDEVLTTVFTFVSTVNVILHRGATPVLVDIDPKSLVISTEEVKKRITPKTKVIIPVDYGGYFPDYNELRDIAKENEVLILEDAAHSLGGKYKNEPAGSLGDVGCFSFYANKNFTTGEGGALVTNDEELAERARERVLHGLTKKAWDRYREGGDWRYDVVYPGYKYNLPDVLAAIGVAQLSKTDEILSKRRFIATLYQVSLSKVSFLELPKWENDREPTYHLFPVLLRDEELIKKRDAIVEEMKKENVHPSIHFIPVHTFTYYREKFGFSEEDFPNATYTFKRVLSLPLYPSMTSDDAKTVIGTLLRADKRV